MTVVLIAAAAALLAVGRRPIPAASRAVARIVARRALGGASRTVPQRMYRAARRDAPDPEDEVTLLADLVLLGLQAGLTFPAALEVAATEVEGPLRDEVVSVVRSLRIHGVAVGLGHAGGRATRLYAVAARAALSGAPIAGAVAALVEERRDEARARRRAANARLPVRMLLPLALLVLPGFVLLTVGPALLGAVRRLGLFGP